MEFLRKILKQFNKDLAIDLGTANTLVFSPGEGIILNEPSVVAMQKNFQNDKKVLAVGKEAKHMLGRTPGSIIAVRPIKDGVIADFEITQQMLKYFISKSTEKSPRFIKPRIVICVPYGITQVEKRAVEESALSAGAREVHLIEEPLAAATGAGLPITEASGNLVVDIGGGTTGVAIISLGGIVICESIKVGGDKFDESIVNYIRRNFNLLIGERTAENIKIKIGTAFLQEENKTLAVNGRDLVSGTPKTITLNRFQINKALTDPLEKIIGTVRLALEKTPPELASDIVDNGLILTGGGALLHNMDILLKDKTGLPVCIAENPLSCVVLGAGKSLDQIDLLKQITIK